LTESSIFDILPRKLSTGNKIREEVREWR